MQQVQTARDDGASFDELAALVGKLETTPPDGVGASKVGCMNAENRTVFVLRTPAKLRQGAAEKCDASSERKPHCMSRAENNLTLKVISKWQANPDAVEALEKMQEAVALALEGL